MIKLVDKESGSFLGEITEEQLGYLIDQLEEESEEDVPESPDDARVEWAPAEAPQEETDERRHGGFRETWDEVWSSEPVPTAPVAVQSVSAVTRTQCALNPIGNVW